MATQTSQNFLEEFYSTAQGGTKEDRKRQTGIIPFKGPPFNSSHSGLPNLVEHSALGRYVEWSGTSYLSGGNVLKETEKDPTTTKE